MENYYTEEELYWKDGGNTGTLPDRVTPSRVNELQEDEVFVFGSNERGHHGAGAARAAMDRFGAVWGIGEGRQGKSYAIPTMEGIGNLEYAVGRFTLYASQHADTKFFVTAIGCGIAGHTPFDVAPLFYRASLLENVYLPVSFWKILLEYQDNVRKCQYFAGECCNPFDALSHIGKESIYGVKGLSEGDLLWYYEKLWASWALSAAPEKDKSLLKDASDFYIEMGLSDFESEDGVPLSLKAILFNRYCHWGGDYDPESNAKSFRNWYLRLYHR